jgi:hypothetical protein
VAHLKHGRRKTPCFIICFRLLLVRHGHQQKAGKQSTEHKSEDVTDQSHVAGTSARRVDEGASAVAASLPSLGKAGPARVVALTCRMRLEGAQSSQTLLGRSVD